MAELEKKFFGNLKGSLGDVVFRSRNEKNYIAQKPTSYTSPDDPQFKARTGKFRMAVKLASAVYSFYPIKKIWSSVVASGKSPFSYLVQLNYPFVENGDISNMVNMVPRSSFGVNLQNIVVDNESVVIELAPLTDLSNIDVNIEKKIQILAVVLLQQPVQDTLPAYDFLKISSLKLDITMGNPLTFNIPYSTADVGISDNYTKRKVIFTALTFDEHGSVVQYSSTINPTV